MDPGVSTNQIAEKIDLSASSIRTALAKLKNNSNYYAVLFDINPSSVIEALIIRDGIVKARNNYKKVKVKQAPKDRIATCKLPWLGKANWPASKTATKKSLTNAELVKACGQHYKYENGKYMLNKEEKIRATILIIKNRTNLKTQKGRPSIPTSFTFT